MNLKKLFKFRRNEPVSLEPPFKVVIAYPPGLKLAVRDPSWLTEEGRKLLRDGVIEITPGSRIPRAGSEQSS